MSKYYSLAVFIFFLFLTSCITMVSSSHGATEEEIWLVPEEERVYDNHINSSNLLFPYTTNITRFAIDLGNISGNREILEYIEFMSDDLGEVEHALSNNMESEHLHYRYKYTDNGFLEVAFDHAGNIIQMQVSLSNRTNISTDDFADEVKLELEQIGLPLDGSENVSVEIYTRHNGGEAIRLRVYQTYKGRNVYSSSIETGTALNEEGNMASGIGSLYVGAWYNITVEPYLTEYGAKCFALPEGWGPDTNISLDDFAVVQNKLMYHVVVVYEERVFVNESSGAYYDSTQIQHYFVDVQDGNVTMGRFLATNGDTTTPDDDDSSFLPAFTTPFIIAAAAAVVSMNKRHREK